MNCVICGGRIVNRCRCMRSDTTCENGHQYHYGPNGEIHQGHSNHGSTICCMNAKISNDENKENKENNDINNIDEIRQYQINRATEYLKNNIPSDGVEPKLEWSIICELLNIIKNK